MNSTAFTPFEQLADYERRSLAHVAGEPEQIENPGLWRGICFRVGKRLFASSIGEISELLVNQPLTHVPGTRDWMLGIANIRGNLVPVVDLGRFLFDQRTQATDRSRLLLVRQHGGNVGLLVDEIIGQRSIGDEHRDAAYEEEDERVARFVSDNATVGEQRIGMFSMNRLTRAPDFLQAAL
ncbi:chemotaxis protein CheW [Oleiagrimonas soli]|uniref:Chemotaxis protein CheW n=1 Tax=Oleiagrimonas soli TaxID=1543381 RepID=A0A099CXM1_9GAMM|nr:chemotaxis protein CheW [Oleiagrimonas soli]KGI78738.1 chemotaxis protein CheW [Oleiagrimonas soli]MBB6184075.1 twitching motility protein PilI [Oleiagrimonas soli]